MVQILCEEIFGSLKNNCELESQLAFIYGKCKTYEKEELIKSLLVDNELRKTIKHLVKESNAAIKSTEESNALRGKGSELFRDSKFEESLWMYNRSVIYAPEGRSLALALGNRSASLFRLKLYELCIKDIKLALDAGYPLDLQQKLHMRLGHSFLDTGHYQKAINSFKMAENCEGDSISRKKRDEIHTLIGNCLAKNLECTTTGNLDSCLHSSTITVPDPSYGDNKLLPYASANLHTVLVNGKSDLNVCLSWYDQRQNLKKGRCVCAKKGVEAGEVLFAEPAYALVLNLQEELRRCHFCSDAVVSAIPCLSCVVAIYCSSNCLEQAWQHHHRFECGYRIISRFGWAPKLALRVMLRGGMNMVKNALTLEEVCKKKTFSEENNEETSKFCNISIEDKLYLRMNELILHFDKEEPLKRFRLVAAAVILSYFLSENKKWKLTFQDIFFDKLGPEKALENLTAVAVKHISQVAANNFLIRDSWTDEDSLLMIGWKNQGASEGPSPTPGQMHSEIASAIYVSSSMLNHSCKPNSTHSYFRQYLIVKANEAIPKGGEVCIHYGPQYIKESKKDRIRFLKENCFFECECEACSNPSKFNSQRSRAYLCPECKGPLVSTEEEGIPHVEHEMICLSCGKELNRKEYFENGVDSGYFRYFKGLKALERNDIEDALWNFKECKRILEKFLFSCNISFVKVLDRIAFCYARQENFEVGIQYLTYSLRVLEHNFGPESMDVAFMLPKMINLLLASMTNLKDDVQKRKIHQLSLSYTERATQILQLHGGYWFHSLRELKEAKEKMNLFTST